MKWKKKCHLQLYYLPFNVSDFGVLSSTPLIWVTVSVCIVSDIFCAFFKSLRPCLCTRDNLVYNVVSRSIQIKWINVASEIKRVFEIWGTSDFWWSKYLERVEWVTTRGGRGVLELENCDDVVYGCYCPCQRNLSF